MATMNKTAQTLRYIFADYLAALLAWAVFFIARKYAVNPDILNTPNLIFNDYNLYRGLLVIPLSWTGLYALTGTYVRVYRKSRLKELGQTLLITLIGVTIIFFLLILDDEVASYKGYYYFFLLLFCLHFGFTFSFRLVLTSITAYRIHKRIIGFNTVIIGSNGNAINIYNEIESEFRSSGNKFIGFVSVIPNEDHPLAKQLPHLGHYKSIQEVLKSRHVEEVIIAIEPSEHSLVQDILTHLEGTGIVVKVIPDMHDILLGSVKMSSIFHAPLIHIYPDLMPAWQVSIKRLIDIIFSILALILLSPIYLVTAIGVKLSSPGPIFYSHERIGLNGKPFVMHKFRSMYRNAESNGPQLSHHNDPRITAFGRYMRKVRLDEIPQFYNVLIGDMSLVGYRPERKHYIDRILEVAPHYKFLLKIKPGITSWGQVKYGYAENVTQMVERLKYDILYLENMSLAMDLKIMIYTLMIVALGRGK
jgi:exopolysaccharide biosynthesis polyprenyl glycosylphosphotransferase